MEVSAVLMQCIQCGQRLYHKCEHMKVRLRDMTCQGMRSMLRAIVLQRLA